MLFPYLALKLWIVEQQIGKLGSLLDEVKLGHALGLALKFRGGNSNQVGQHVA